MALYHQLKFPSTFIEYRSVSEWKGVVVISNFDSLEAPLQIYRPRQLPSLPRPKFAPTWNAQHTKVKQSLYMSWELQELQAARFPDSRHMKVARLSTLDTGRLYPPGYIPGTHLC